MRQKWIALILVVILGLMGTVAVLAAGDNALGVDMIFIPFVSRAKPPTLTPNDRPGFCTCASNNLNCDDFSTHNQAQACFEHCVSLGY